MFTKIVVILLMFLKLIRSEVDLNTNVVRIDLKIPENFDLKVPNLRDSRILHGNSAFNGQFPFAAFLQIQRGSIITFCTGALIARNWIITARSCFVINPNSPADSLLAFLGSNDMASTAMLSSFADQGAFFNNPDGINPNIALFRLENEMPETSLIRTIRLPRLVDEHFGFDDFNITTLGWGRLSNNSFPRLLQFANFRILAVHLCFWNQNFRTFDFCSQHQTLLSMTDTERDIGGPSVIVENDGQVTLIGITSDVMNLPNGPAVSSVRVSSYLRFINANTGIPFR
ncbi:collagenase-like [Chironomus tepperi]|uniref:collagenase-like n=1 Tax=Chironomus tepperi TaxID=113505 RepID=UPI00391F0B5B